MVNRWFIVGYSWLIVGSWTFFGQIFKSYACKMISSARGTRWAYFPNLIIILNAVILSRYLFRVCFSRPPFAISSAEAHWLIPVRFSKVIHAKWSARREEQDGHIFETWFLTWKRQFPSVHFPWKFSYIFDFSAFRFTYHGSKTISACSSRRVDEFTCITF
jgi:hypothetical protein